MTKQVNDYNNATQQLVKAQQQVTSLVQQSSNEWRKQSGTIEDNINANERLNKELKDVQKRLKEVQSENNGVTKEMSEQAKKAGELRGIIERNQKMGFGTKIQEEQLAKLTTSIDNSKKSVTELRKEELLLKAAISENNIVTKNQIKEINASDGSMTKMSQTLGLMRKLYRDLNLEERNSDFGKNLQIDIKLLDKELKDLDATIGNHQRKVGDYEGGFKKAFEGIRSSFDSLLSGDIKGALSSFSDGIDGITQTITYLTPAIKTATTATSAETASLILNSTASTTAATASTALAGANARETASSTAVTAATNAETASLEANAVATGQAATASSAAAGGGMKQLLGSLKELTLASLRFIATPLGAALMVLVGLAAASKAIWDYNSGLQVSITLTKQFTGLTGSAADSVRQQAQALSDTYGNEFQQNLKAAQKLVQNFGISYNQAFLEIERGLVRGGAANEEYFQSINEYPVFFAKAGYSASQFIDLINAGFSSGVYNDKLIDAIKEADLALREQTKATRDALVNAFGASFSDDILQRIRTGRTSVKDALNEIAEQAGKTALTEQQLGQLTADVFKGAGEDVGGTAKIFDIVRKSVEEANRPLTETEKHLQDLTDANKELQAAMDDALKVDGVISLQQSLELLWVKVKTAFFEVLKPIREFYEWGWKIMGRSESLANIWNDLQKIGVSFNKIIESLQITIGNLSEKLGVSSDETSKFYKAIGILFDPIVQLESGLNKFSKAIEFVAVAFEKCLIFAEAFVDTITEVYNGVRKLDFSSLENIGAIFLKNASKISAENKERAENARIARMQAEANKTIVDTMSGINEQIQIEMRTREDARIQAKKAAEEAEKLQKKYAAEEKKRLDAAKKALQERLSEELSVMQETLDIYNFHTKSYKEFQVGLTDIILSEANKRADETLKKEIEIAEKVASNALSANKLKEQKITFEQVKAANDRGEKLNSIQLKLLKSGLEAERKNNDEKNKNFEDSIKFKQSILKSNIDYQSKIYKIDLDNAIANGKDKEKAEKEYKENVYKYAIQQYEDTYNLDETALNEKINLGEKLEEWEIEYLERKADRRKQDVEEDIAAEKERNKRLKDLKDETKEAREKERKEDLEKQEKASEMSLEIIQVGFEKQSEMQEVYRNLQELHRLEELRRIAVTEEQKKELDKKTNEAKLMLAASTLGSLSQFLGEETAMGKVAAIAQATINTYLAATNTLSAFPGPIGIAMAAITVAAGIANVIKIASTTTPKFEDGVINSSYEGLAIKDEAGAEIQLDKSGNIKDWGSNSGSKNFHIKKGDTILPNPVSERIKDLMSHNPMPDLMMSLNLNGLLKQNNYDFERLEKKFDKLERAIKTKENVTFVDAGDYLIEATKSNGSTHQRFIPKAGININQQQPGL